MIKNNCFYARFRALDQYIRGLEAIKVIAYIALIFLSLQAGATSRQAQSGEVTRVVDGDTLWVKTSTSSKPLKVRIQGIDAPEICQPGGLAARDFLMQKVSGQQVTVTSGARDDYGRTVGTVHWQGQDIGRWLVAQGHAWVYTYRSKKAPYSEEFSRAQGERRGLFSAAVVEEPREFRKRFGSCHVRRSTDLSYRKSSGV